MSPTRKSCLRGRSGRVMDGASSMDQQPADQQQQMPGGHAPVEQQSVPDGHVPAGQKEQPFMNATLLHPPPLHLQRLLEQQRGYVQEMFRQQHEVVQRQLAGIQQQQLEFMQRQGHILRSIVAAVNEQISLHPEAQECAQKSHVEGNCSITEEVSSEQQESNTASSTDEVDEVNTGCVGDRRKFVPFVKTKSSARVNLDTGSLITKPSTRTWHTIGWQSMSTSSVAEAAAAQMLEVAGKFYYEMTVGGWTFVGQARATREQLFGCGTLDGFGLSPVPNVNISHQGGNHGGNPSARGGTFKADMTKVDSGCVSSFDKRKLAADVASPIQKNERQAIAKYRPLDDALDRLKPDLFFSLVTIPERSPVVREEGVLLQGKYKTRRQCKFLQLSKEAVLKTSQQLIVPKLAGPWRISGPVDDLENPLATHKNEAGRSIITINMQVLEVCLKAYGSIPNQQGVGSAPPSEVILERIRANLEFEPPPSMSASESTMRTRTIAAHEQVYSKYTNKKRQWLPVVDYDRIGRVLFNVVKDDRRQLQPHADHNRSPADWDPGQVAVKRVVFQDILPGLTNNDSVGFINSDALEPNTAAVSLEHACSVERSFVRTLAVSTTSYPHQDHPSSPYLREADLRHRYRCHAVLQGSKDSAVVRPVPFQLKRGDVGANCNSGRSDLFHTPLDSRLTADVCQVATVVTVH